MARSLTRLGFASGGTYETLHNKQGSMVRGTKTHLHFLSLTGRFFAGDAPLPWRFALLHAACEMRVNIPVQGCAATTLHWFPGTHKL